jgi:hypothetical protein
MPAIELHSCNPFILGSRACHRPLQLETAVDRFGGMAQEGQ